MSRLSLQQLQVRRGDRCVIKSLNCNVDAGEAVVILGPNGAGKSSLLLAMAGLIEAAGEITIDGRVLREVSRSELVNHIAWMGDLPPAEFGLTVAQRLALAAESNHSRIAAIADTLDLTLLLSRSLAELSSGERQRTELAALALRDAPIWLLDEPTAHLDLKHQVAAIAMMQREVAAGRTIITVLHDLTQARAVADHLILVDGSGNATYGEADSLFRSDTLSALFGTALIKREHDLIPDYGAIK